MGAWTRQLSRLSERIGKGILWSLVAVCRYVFRMVTFRLAVIIKLLRERGECCVIKIS